MIENPWDKGSPLNEKVHNELMRDVGFYSRLAGIRKEWLWQPLSAHVTTKEIKWISSYRKLRESGVSGLLYVGAITGVQDRMSAMTGALIRNFVDARIRPTSQAITRIGPIEESPPARCSVLFLPDLCVSAAEQPDWFVREVITLFMEREAVGRQTIAYIRSMEMVKAVYGDTLVELLESKRAYPRLKVPK